MSNPSSTGRLHCPNCNARLAIPSGNRSPYIRCGVCDVLFETEMDPADTLGNSTHQSGRVVESFEPDSMPVSMPVSTPVESIADRRRQQQPQRPSAEFDWSRPQRQLSGLRWTTGSVAIIAMLFFGILIFSLLSWADSSHPRSRSRGYSYKTSTNRAETRKAIKVIDEAIDKWNDPSSEYPKFEIDLNADDPAKLNNNVDSIKLDGRHFTSNEISQLVELYKLRKLKYTNVDIQAADLKLLNCQRFFELDLSHSNWNPGQIHFDRKSFPYLTKLNLSYSNVQNFSLVDIEECDKLIQLNLRGTELDDDSISSLKRHPSLQELDISETKVTFDALKKFRIPNLKLLKVTAGVLTTAQREKILSKHPHARVLVINEPN